MAKKHLFLGMSALALTFVLLLGGCSKPDTWAALTEGDKAKLVGIWEGKATVPVKDENSLSTSVDLTLALANESGSDTVKTGIEMDYTKFIDDFAKNPEVIASGESADDLWSQFSFMFSMAGAKLDGKKISMSVDGKLDDMFEDSDSPQINQDGKKLKFTMPISFVMPGAEGSEETFDIVLTQVKSSKLIQ